MILENIYKN